MSTSLMVAGLVLMFFGVWGTIILPDLLLRLHASTKCGVTGSVTFLLGLAIEAGLTPLTARLMLIIVFLFWTAPLIPHIMGLAFVEESRRTSKDPP